MERLRSPPSPPAISPPPTACGQCRSCSVPLTSRSASACPRCSSGRPTATSGTRPPVARNTSDACRTAHRDNRPMVYARFAGFYDAIMGDRTADIDRIRGYIDRYLPSAASLLELGCGTGAVLAGLADKLSATGIDLSPEMLAVASRSIPGARLVQANM